jgi:hypothetical protein
MRSCKLNCVLLSFFPEMGEESSCGCRVASESCHDAGNDRNVGGRPAQRHWLKE